MPVTLDIAGDFSLALDGLEPLTLVRRATGEETVVPLAWRYSQIERETQPSNGHVTEVDVVWQFPDPDAEKPLRLGDALRDGSGDYWTILQLEVLQSSSRLRCLSRELKVSHGLDNRIDIEEAIWDTGGPTPVITGWRNLRTAVPARIQLVQTMAEHDTNPPTSSSTFWIYLADPTPLDHNHRLRAQDGTLFQINSYSQGDRIDLLPQVEASAL